MNKKSIITPTDNNSSFDTYDDIDCLHIFDCKDEINNGFDTTYTYECYNCGQLRNETQDNATGEIIDTDIIIQGEI